MSQVYEWFNYDKRERLDWWWAGGGKLWAASWTGHEGNNALLTLLTGRWKGDRVIRYGCEGLELPDDGRPFLKEIEGVCVEDIYFDSLARDVTGLFEEAAGQINDVFDDDGEFVGEAPYEGPFELTIQWYRYVLNLDRKQFYDRERTAVIGVWDGKVFRDELFPALCTIWGRSEMVGGGRLESWFGEVLAASNERPGDDFEDITDVHRTASVPTDLTDEEILAFVNKGAPNLNVDPKAWNEHASRRLDELFPDRRGKA